MRAESILAFLATTNAAASVCVKVKRLENETYSRKISINKLNLSTRNLQ